MGYHCKNHKWLKPPNFLLANIFGCRVSSKIYVVSDFVVSIVSLSGKMCCYFLSSHYSTKFLQKNMVLCWDELCSRIDFGYYSSYTSHVVVLWGSKECSDIAEGNRSSLWWEFCAYTFLCSQPQIYHYGSTVRRVWSHDTWMVSCRCLLQSS